MTEAETSIVSDRQRVCSTIALLDSETNDAEKPGQGFKRLLQKLKEEDKEHKAWRIEYISYDEANKRTGYDRYGWPS